MAVTDIPVDTSGCMGDEQMWFVPRRPNIGVRTEVSITSMRHHDVRSIRLTGPLDPGVPTERLSTLGFVWTWTITPSVEAFHQWTFYADGLRPCITSGFNAYAPLGATATPTETPVPTETPSTTPTTTPTGLPAAPRVTAVSANSGECGSALNVTGINFGGTQAEVQGQVFFSGPSGSVAQNYLSWSNSSITVSVPTQLIQNQVYTVVVTHAGGSSQNPNPAAQFTANGPGCAPPATSVPARPSVTSLSANAGDCGDALTINGTNFGATQSSGTVFFSGSGGAAAFNYLEWTNTRITVIVPDMTNNVTYTVLVTTSGGTSQNPNAAAQFHTITGC
jgi:hypothetical protein